MAGQAASSAIGRIICGGLTPTNSLVASKLRTPLSLPPRPVRVRNERLILAAATSSEANSSQEQAEKVDRIKQTLADLDALLGIEETTEEEEEAPKVCILPPRPTAWPSMLDCLAISSCCSSHAHSM